MLTIGRRLAIFGLMAMTMAMVGCGDDDDDGGTTPTNIAGTYTMRSLNNDNSAPFLVFQVTGYMLEVTSATVTLNANGTYSDVTTIRETIDGTAQTPETIPSTGTWVRSGNTVSFTDDDDPDANFTATVQSDGALTVSESFEGVTVNARYTK
jgi:uncharacterized lipoprotein NlpE involved in copper resistance